MIADLIRYETHYDALSIIEFWKEAGEERWFTSTPEFDDLFRTRFLSLYEKAAEGDLDHWSGTPRGSLALILLLDQFPRNCFRNTPRMYQTDAHARRIATVATAWGQDLMIERELRLFMYMPFAHSEDLRDHERGKALVAHLGPAYQQHAHRYADIIERFGRYPHRNAILGRETTSDEEMFLRNGGFSG